LGDVLCAEKGGKELMALASIIVPVFSGEAYLAETLESLRNQTVKDIEIIVVNDASPDYTDDLMGWYLSQDKRIKYYIFETNKGVCEARNYGNQMATAEYLFPNDQDDLSLPDRVEVSLAFMEAHPEIDCITTAFENCDVNAKPVQRYVPEDMTKELFESGNFVWFHSSACYRKKDILEFPYKEMEGCTDDWVFLKTWLSAGKKFKTLPEVLGACRRTPWGVMQQRRAAQGLAGSWIP
jgi:glycosyltransferase involved in cell wall biosynthesis